MGLNSHLSFAGTFSDGNVTASGGTAFARVIPGAPYQQGSGWPIYDMTKSPRLIPQTLAHVSKVIYTTGATAHAISILRPYNYTWASSPAATGQATIALHDDPGIFSTNYKYAIGNSKNVCQVADRGINSSGDYVVYQLADGTWVSDTVSGYTGGVLTLAANIPAGTASTGNGVLVGAPIYFYGLASVADPATGHKPPTTNIAASQVRDASWADTEWGICAALHAGDPLLFFSPNGTNAGVLESINGWYAKV